MWLFRAPPPTIGWSFSHVEDTPVALVAEFAVMIVFITFSREDHSAEFALAVALVPRCTKSLLLDLYLLTTRIFLVFS